MVEIVLALVIIVIGYLYYLQYVRARTADEAAAVANNLALDASRARQSALLAKVAADAAAGEARAATNAIDAKNKILIAETAKAESARLTAIALEAECRASLSVMELEKIKLLNNIKACGENVAQLDAVKTQLRTDVDACASNVAKLESAKAQLSTDVRACSDNVTALEAIKAQLRADNVACANNVAELTATVADMKTQIAQMTPTELAQELMGVWYPIRGPAEPGMYIMFDWVGSELIFTILSFQYGPKVSAPVRSVVKTDNKYTVDVINGPVGSALMNITKKDDQTARFGMDPNTYIKMSFGQQARAPPRFVVEPATS